ncbi:NFATC2-interacting protein isoform X2 [Chironomus tepperi]|uniref:NFATC2-interacting protein isoform X2 n=1 Tax=Chironomus tepperi TaxID=113505 RepID=UPI00391F549C
MDVFGKLNDFLNNDESFKYDSLEVIDDSIVEDKPEPSQQNENQSQNSSKSNKSQENSQKLRRSKRGRSSTSQNSSNDDILDLTNEFIYPTHGGKRKNRRKLADDIPAVVIEEQIDLSNIVTPDSSINISNASTSSGRGGRKGKKPKAPRKVSYKKALELLTAPITEAVSQQSSSEFVPQASSTQRTRSNDFAVDLTGDVEMSDMHNKNPLFQKVDKVKEKIEIPEERFSLGLDDDIDLIYVNVKIRGKIKKYQIKMDQRFYDLFKMIANDEDIPTSNVVLFIGEKRIHPEDTPDSIDHRVSFIYTCRFMDSSNIQVNKKDKIEIKFQSDKWKKPIALKVSRFEPFLSHIQLLCKEVNFKPEQFSLKFDGDDIDMKNSAIELEFEGGEIIDCRVKT